MVACAFARVDLRRQIGARMSRVECLSCGCCAHAHSQASRAHPGTASTFQAGKFMRSSAGRPSFL
eukprot:scaffold62047_cov26-Tisochrysis_lutea.AAC.1